MSKAPDKLQIIVEENVQLMQPMPTYLSTDRIPHEIVTPRGYGENLIEIRRRLDIEERLEQSIPSNPSITTKQLQEFCKICIITQISKPAISLALEIFEVLDVIDSHAATLAIINIADKTASTSSQCVELDKKIYRLLMNKFKRTRVLSEKESAFVQAKKSGVRSEFGKAVIEEFEEFKWQIYEYEVEILLSLDYKLNFVSISDFLLLFAEVCELDSVFLEKAVNLIYSLESRIDTRKFLPSMVASACVIIMLEEQKQISWDKSLYFWSGYEIEQLQPALDYCDRFWELMKVEMQ